MRKFIVETAVAAAGILGPMVLCGVVCALVGC